MRPGQSEAHVRFGPRGRLITSAEGGKTIEWEARTGRIVRRHPVGGRPALSPDGETIAVAVGLDPGSPGSKVTLLDLGSGRRSDLAEEVPDEWIEQLAFTPDGSRIVGASVEGLRVWDVESGAIEERFGSGVAGATLGATFDRRLRFEAPVFATAISPDGRLLAVLRQADGVRDATVDVRDLDSGATLFTRTVRGGAGDVRFSHDGRALFASGCCRGGSTVASWDARTGARRFERTSEDHMTAFALLPDSSALLVADEDGALALWDARTGRQRGPATTVAPAGVTQIAASPDGRLFAVADFSGSATLWDVRTRKRVGDEFTIPPGVIPSVTFEPNGRLLITERGSAVDWPLDRRTLQRFACRVAGRDLTRDEWSDLLPSRPYRPVCRAGEAAP